MRTPACLAAIGLFLFGLTSHGTIDSARASFATFTPVSGGAGFSASANGRLTGTPSIDAYRLAPADHIRVDGVLDDPCWHRADAGTGFSIWDPDRGSPPSEDTVFKVAYDDDAVYFAIACHESDPGRIASTLSRRDRLDNSDYVSIYIDPYHDRTTGYNFVINPSGVQQDGYVYNDGDSDRDWDAVWEAETYEDRDGWYAELRIPFSSIRYRQGSPRWGLQVYRFMHARGEDTAWTLWDRDTPGFVSRFGELNGLRDVPAPRQLEIVPYTVVRATDHSVPGDDELDGFENVGVDLNYGITSDLKLNATIQPDFGQVEADPAVLNLSPFETFFDEKRPFFVEGNRFFQHQDFNLFYSRRIGTGDENARIRYASKLTGKTAGDISVAALVASTDVTGDGQTHNVLKSGDRASHYFVGRFGKEFDGGNHRINITQTGVINTASRDEFGDRASREAYTSGVDFRLQFADRKYRLDGSVVGSVIDPEGLASDPDFHPSTTTGTGGELSFARRGELSAGGWFRWESDRLDLNDLGFLNAPDEMNAGAWLSRELTPDGQSAWLNRGNVNLNLFKGWLYGARTAYDLHTGAPVWHYSRGHRAFAQGDANGWMQFRNYAEAWWGLQYVLESTQRYETRSAVEREDGSLTGVPGGGPLLDEPTTYGGWWGGSTDTRKTLVFRTEGSYFRDVAANHSTGVSLGAEWSQSSAMKHEIDVSFRNRVDDTQHLGNFENPGGGIGGVSYVFGEIHQRTLDVTLRTSWLFSRSQSLEMYAQPFISVGDYSNARELVRPDSYDLEPYTRNGFRAGDRDFSYSAVNLNAVYRWEYRPGSTLYLVWTHSRSSYAERRLAADPASFENGLGGRAFFDNEPENVFLAKITYWLPI